MTALIFGALKNPFTWLCVALMALFMGLQFYMGQNALKEKDIQMYKQQEAAYEQIFKAQQQSIGILQNDMVLMNDLANSKQTVVVRQQNLDRQLNAIKDTSTNYPFTNPELNDAARIVRDYQQSSPVTNNSTSTDSK